MPHSPESGPRPEQDCQVRAIDEAVLVDVGDTDGLRAGAPRTEQDRQVRAIDDPVGFFGFNNFQPWVDGPALIAFVAEEMGADSDTLTPAIERCGGVRADDPAAYWNQPGSALLPARPSRRSSGPDLDMGEVILRRVGRQGRLRTPSLGGRGASRCCWRANMRGEDVGFAADVHRGTVEMVRRGAESSP